MSNRTNSSLIVVSKINFKKTILRCTNVICFDNLVATRHASECWFRWANNGPVMKDWSFWSFCLVVSLCLWLTYIFVCFRFSSTFLLEIKNYHPKVLILCTTTWNKLALSFCLTLLNWFILWVFVRNSRWRSGTNQWRLISVKCIVERDLLWNSCTSPHMCGSGLIWSLGSLNHLDL